MHHDSWKGRRCFVVKSVFHRLKRRAGRLHTSFMTTMLTANRNREGWGPDARRQRLPATGTSGGESEIATATVWLYRPPFPMDRAVHFNRDSGEEHFAPPPGWGVLRSRSRAVGTFRCVRECCGCCFRVFWVVGSEPKRASVSRISEVLQ